MFEKIKRWVRFNLFYLGRPPWDTGVSPPELKDFLHTTHPGRALDVGCGTGTNLLTMAQHGWEVVGVDIAWLSVLRARKKLKEAGFDARVIHGDVTGNLGFQKGFNLVLDIGCYHSLTPQGRRDYRHNLSSWLTPGGTFLLYAHKRTSPDDSHGIVEQDLAAFQPFLDLEWREDSDEKRPDGGGGRPATWARFSHSKGN